MKSKCLYIHGLDSMPSEDKLEKIKKYSEVFALHIDYRNEPNAFKILSASIEENSITDIIGSSMGGYLGFWLSLKHNIPCLLFNPALSARSINMDVEVVLDNTPKQIIILGEKDNTIDPNSTIIFLKEKFFEHSIKEIIINSAMEHRIDISNFEKYTSYYFESKKFDR